MEGGHFIVQRSHSATIGHDGFERQWQVAHMPGDWQDDLRVVYRRAD